MRKIAHFAISATASALLTAGIVALASADAYFPMPRQSTPLAAHAPQNAVAAAEHASRAA